MKAVKFMKMCLAAIVMLGFASCGQNEPETPTKVDARDKFVGTYAYEATGSVAVSLGAVNYNIPLDETGTFSISKVGDQDKVALVGYNDTIQAKVSGDQLILESNVINTQYNSIALQLTFSYGQATLSGKQLAWESDVTAYAVYGFFAATGTGTVSVVATKK